MGDTKSSLSRRKFLSTTAVGLASTGLAGMVPGLAFGQEVKGEQEKKEDTVIYRDVGKTGMRLPIVSMGVLNSESSAVVKASYELGVRHFDTAAYYQFGRSESMLGTVFNRLGIREKVNIGTKVYTPRQRVSDPALAKKKIIELFHGSLKRLKTDYVDILYIHDVNNAEDIANEGVLEALAELKEQKKILAAGVATHSNMALVIDAAVKTGFYDVVLTSYNLSMADNAELQNAITNAGKNKVSIIAMKTQSGGGRFNAQQISQYSSKTINQASLRWAVRNKNITTTIPGYDNFDHMREDFAVAQSLEYTDEEKKLLTDNEIQLGMGYCHQCQKCLATCPHDTDIPTLMRTHMYATSYGNPIHAREVFNDIPKSRSLQLCKSCGECTAHCANTVEIGRNVAELKQIYG